MMKPIVFSTAMVEAILNNLKSHTRRLNGLEEINKEPDKWNFCQMYENEHRGTIELFAEFIHKNIKEILYAKAPYQPGDVLWVREKLVKQVANNGECFANYADGHATIASNDESTFWAKWKWKRDMLPSIFMPRYAARIFLEVEAVRVEYINAITLSDVKAEGFESLEEFIDYWNLLNGKDAWDRNDYVFVYKFRRAECQP